MLATRIRHKPNVAYVYDGAGRRTARSATQEGSPETPLNATYDAANRLVALSLAGVNYTLAYDANGNLTHKVSDAGNTTRYLWDARGQLAGIESPGINAAFQYDALGRRIGRTVNGETTQVLYDGEQAIVELKGGAVSAHLLTGLAIDEVIARYGTTETRTLLTDALGSVLIEARADGSVATAYGYSPYGETQAFGEGSANANRYTAREDDGTGLYYYRARYYDPQLKRFLSEDPIGLAGGINVYAYVGGDPAVMSDPYGLWKFVFNAGFHLPAVPLVGVAGGPSVGSSWTPNQGLDGASYDGVTADVVVGAIADVGVSAGIGGLSSCEDGNPRSLNFGLGRYGGVQLNFKGAQFDGITIGIGVGLSLPITATIPAK